MGQPGPVVRYKLSADGMTLVIQRPAPAGGWHVTTLHRRPAAGPFTAADIIAALTRGPRNEMLPGQRNRTHRTETRFGVVWTHLMLGPPTWWLPMARIAKDGTVMAGWLRLAVAIKLDRQETRP